MATANPYIPERFYMDEITNYKTMNIQEPWHQWHPPVLYRKPCI